MLLQTIVQCFETQITFHSLLVKKLGEADSYVGVRQIGVSLPLYWLAQGSAVVKEESLVGEVKWQRNNERQEEEDKEESEEEIWCQIVPADAVDLGDGGVVPKPLVSQANQSLDSRPGYPDVTHS